MPNGVRKKRHIRIADQHPPALRHLKGLDSVEDGIKLVKAFVAYMQVQFTHINVQQKINSKIEAS